MLRMMRWNKLYRPAGWTHAQLNPTTPRDLLPADGANFAFVQWNLTSADSINFPASLQGKLSGEEFENLVKSLVTAYNSSAAPPVCPSALLCLLLPCGPCLYFSAQASMQAVLRLEGVGDACAKFNAETFKDRCIVVSYLSEDGLDGLVFEVSPTASDGQPNSTWTGPNPMLSAQQGDAIRFDLQVAQGVQVDETQYVNALMAEATLLNGMATRESAAVLAPQMMITLQAICPAGVSVGDIVMVQTPQGPMQVQLPPGAQPGMPFSYQMQQSAAVVPTVTLGGTGAGAGAGAGAATNIIAPIEMARSS